MHRLVLLALLAAAGPLQAESSLELEDCRISAGPGSPGISAQCGWFERPINPDQPEDGTLELRVAVVPALSLEPALDPFVPIAGGPGQSSIQFYAGWSYAFEAVRQHRDMLLIDQRGTGQSAPMVCEMDEDALAGDYSPEETARLTRACLTALPYDPRYFTTSVAVEDIEAVRKALGYDALNVYGASYGTRVAQHYARRYPETTRTVTIDGVVPPQLPLGPDIAIQSQRALDSVFSRCAEEPGCNAEFPDLADDFTTLHDRLSEEPVLVTFHHPVTGKLRTEDIGVDHLNGAIRLLLYNPRTIALLPLMISDAADGNYAPLAAQFFAIAESLSADLNIGMHNAVMCTEDEPFVDDNDIDREQLQATYMGPLMFDAIEAMCSVWPAGVLDDNLLQPLATDLPVLLLSGEADPITPADYAEEALVEMTNKAHLVLDDQGHGVAGVGCMPRVLATFVDTATPPERPDCLDRAFVMPFFLDYSGPAP
ncbi:MAG: alpha/beta fold hydrolase [Pseudomonadota bacterium]